MKVAIAVPAVQSTTQTEVWPRTRVIPKRLIVAGLRKVSSYNLTAEVMQRKHNVVAVGKTAVVMRIQRVLHMMVLLI